MKPSLTCAFVVAAALAATGVGRAAVIISNPSVDDNTQTGLTGARIKAMGFTMGATSFNLDSLSLRLCFDAIGADFCGGIADGDGIPTVRLFSDSAGAPGTEQLTFTNPVFAVGLADYTFLPGGPFTLVGGTSYWLVVHSANGGDFNWEANDPATTPTGPFATHLGSLFKDTGAPTPPASTDLSGILNIYALNGAATDVPEPSTLLLFTVGGIVVALRRRN